MNTVPFSVDILAGFGKCEGMLKDAGGGTISIEFQNSDKFGGLIKSDVKQVNVPLNDLTSVTITKGWLGNTWLGVKIVLQGKNLTTLKDVPGMSQGRVELNVARKDVAAAERFVDGLHEANG
jgi:hypothetical protein